MRHIRPCAGGRVSGPALAIRVLPLLASIVLGIPVAGGSPLAASGAAGVPSFANEVMAVLSRAGCNQGTCHGNRSGKGGFKLSLRGDDPEHDFQALTRELGGRRSDPLRPQRSLILLKPTAELPHEGGRRFARGSLEYGILHAWIAAGMPRDPPGAPSLEELEVEPREVFLVDPESEFRLEARARFSDGSTRDIGPLAVYETSNQIAEVSPDGVVRRLAFGEVTVLVRFLDQQVPVRAAFLPARDGFEWRPVPENNSIDRHVFSKLARLRILPSELSSDSVFLRRASFDLLGMPPCVEDARAFAADTRPDKRTRKIDELLERPDFADFWALKWSDLLRNEERVIDRKGVQNFHHWIRQSIAEGKPFDRFVRELIAARGSTYASPPANYYRANRDPASRAETTAQVFLGTRLQCAKCHNHPFDRWTQADYYGWAALFARVRYEVLENRRRDRNDTHEFDGEQVVWMAREGTVEDPRVRAPAPPRFLGAETPAFDREDDPLESLAEWLTRPENSRFARVQVNRIWYHLMGRGLVDPVDDFRSTNPPSHPELLDALAEDFVESGYDVRHTIRTIMRSRAYQLSSLPNATNADDETNYSRAVVRRWSAEQLLDGLSRALQAPVPFNGYPLGLRAAEVPGVRAVRDRDRPLGEGEKFLVLFGKPDRLLTCECERSSETSLSQTFQLTSGPLVHSLLTRPDNRLGRLLASGAGDREAIEELYWAALSRAPAPGERDAALALFGDAVDRRAALEDVAWSLVNAKEFLLRW